MLRNAIRNRQATRCAILVDRAAPDDGPNPVAVVDRVLEPLDDNDAATLATHVAVCGRVECLAPAIGREHVSTGESDHGRRREQDVRATGQCQVAFTEAQRLAGLMDCHQRRTARRVDGDRGTLQPQSEADPARRCGVRRPDRHIGLDLGESQVAGCHAQVIVGGQTDEHACVRVRQSRWRSAGMLHRPPRRLQQEPMLWVQHPDLARRHAEERRIEPRHVVDETRPTSRNLPRCIWVRVEEFVDIPPVGGHLGDRVAAFSQHIPELIRVRGPGETRRISDDRKTGWRLLALGCHALSSRLGDLRKIRSPRTARMRNRIAGAPQYCKCHSGGSAGLSAPYRKVWLSTPFHAEWFDVKG